VPNDSTVELVADEDDVRLDRYVARRCPELSRTQAQRLIEEGRVTVNGIPAKASLKVFTGDRITVNVPAPEASRLTPEAIPVKIVYEDNDLLVVEKPAGLTVHPAPGHREHTLLNAILSHLPELPETGDGTPPIGSVPPGGRLRPGVVHRLDKDTSGLIIIAKNARAHLNLSDQFKQRSVSKVYLALVEGRLEPRDGVIEAPIGRDRSHRERMAVVDEAHGRAARTGYHVVRYADGYSLLEVKPETGRTHQIRVHLAAIGHPVAGDRVYGAKASAFPRQFLHAHRLAFDLPSDGRRVEFESPLPPDLAGALEKLG